MASVMLERTADLAKRFGAKSYAEFEDANGQRYGKFTFADGKRANVVRTNEIISAIPGAAQLTNDEAQHIAYSPDKGLCGSFQEALEKGEWFYTVPPTDMAAAWLSRSLNGGLYAYGYCGLDAAPVVLFKLMLPMEEKRYTDDAAIPTASDLTEKSTLLRRAWSMKKTDSTPHIQEHSHKAQ